VVLGGVRYVAMGGELEASDPSTGESLWVRHSAAGAVARSLGTVALAGSALVVSTRAGELYGLDVDTGYTLWAYRLSRRVTAEPIVARGWIYTATRDGRVVALNVADATLDGWHMFGGNARHNGPTL
jgi:Ca-activated chloride channel family protein